jgi:hypothetical protein
MRKVKDILFLVFISDSKLSWKSWSVPKVLLTLAKRLIPNMLFFSCSLKIGLFRKALGPHLEFMLEQDISMVHTTK